MLDWLKTILGEAYTEEIDGKVSAEIGKAFVSKADFNTLNRTKKQLEADIAERDRKIGELEAVDTEGLQGKVNEWERKYNEDTQALQAKLDRQALDHLVDMGLSAAKAKNLKAARALLDFDKITLENDALKGFDEQLKTAVGENPYLFGEEGENPAPGGGDPAGGSEEFNQWMAEAGLPLGKSKE